ncbi:MAG: CotH kinase family protein, partial [Verrucomicrobiae bacterium]|nr:CotH kinase family protein [Verrucomicrobiae bacterium]
DPGLRHHYLYGANPPLLVREEDRLFADVWLNPEAPPSEVMMAWYDGSSDHRAYWGANLIAQGLPGTAGRFRAGDLPPAGQWTRLEVAAADVGLGDSARVSGMTFLAFGGEVLWDRSGRLTQHAGGSRRYEEALELDATTVVRAVTVAEGTVPGGEAIRTYVLDFASGLPVVSLAVDSPDLFSVESGLLVLGTNASPSAPYLGANFWRDWEREGWLTVMEPDGTVVEHGGVGVRVQGGWSRSAPQKSLSLRARERYGRGRIAWRVFPELALQSFDSLVLRNSGNDWRHARTRDGLLQGLMRGTAVDMTAFRPAQVFLNGEYWGILNLRERTDGAYLMGHHPEIPDEDAVDLIEDDQKALEGDLTEFLKLAGFIDRHTLADPEDYAALLNWIDLDNYLDWICTELFVDNRDWPGHNVRCWRPRRPEGRWRWILNDLDSSFSLSGEGAERPTLELVAAPVELGAYGGRSTELFRRLLNNPEGREAFLQRFAGLLATRFSSETVRAHIDEVAALLTPEMPWQIARWANSNEPGWPPLPSMEEWFAKLDELRTVAGVRPGSVRQQVVDYFHLPGIVSVTVEVVSGWRGRLWLGREPLEPAGGAIQFDWPAGVLLRLTAEPGVGSRFLGWNDPEEPSPVIEVVPSGPLQLTARFDADDDFDPATLEPPPWPLWSSRYELDGFGPQTPAGSQPT